MKSFIALLRVVSTQMGDPRELFGLLKSVCEDPEDSLSSSQMTARGGGRSSAKVGTKNVFQSQPKPSVPQTEMR